MIKFKTNCSYLVMPESLRNECIIQHAFKHDYILDIFYPPITSIVHPDSSRIETIVVSKG